MACLYDAQVQMCVPLLLLSSLQRLDTLLCGLCVVYCMPAPFQMSCRTEWKEGRDLWFHFSSSLCIFPPKGIGRFKMLLLVFNNSCLIAWMLQNAWQQLLLFKRPWFIGISGQWASVILLADVTCESAFQCIKVYLVQNIISQIPKRFMLIYTCSYSSSSLYK